MPPDPLPASLEAGSTIRALAPGELLFRQGDPAAAIYKVESGRLRLIRRTVDDHLVILHTARRGEFFAEASLFADAYHCDAVAAAQSIVRVYQKEIVSRLSARTRHWPRRSWRDLPVSYRNSGLEWNCGTSARREIASFNT